MYALLQYFPNVFARGPLLTRKVTTDPYIPAYVNIGCPGDRYTKFLKIYISKSTLDSYEYVTVGYVTRHCMI